MSALINPDGDVGLELGQVWRYHPMIAVPESYLEAARRAAAHVIVADLDAPELAGEDRHHVESVLRLRVGEVVSATDGRGAGRLCRFGAEGALLPETEVVLRPRPSPSITVGFTPIKGDRPEWAVQKLAEIGVDRIVILRAARSVVRWEGERTDRHLARLRAVVRQAVMQSRQVWLPELIGVEDALSMLANPGVAIAAPGGAPPSLDVPTVLVGPEGGWSGHEEESAGARLDLGPTVLRTESAAVAAGVLLVGLRAGLVRPA